MGVSAYSISSCGYKVAGKANLLPKDIQSIGIPPFQNVTTRYKLTERFPALLTREFLARTKYEILPDANGADAVLQGTINSVLAFPVLFDAATGRASGVQVQAVIAITLRNLKTGTVLYTNPGFDFRQRYEISTDPLAFFDESTPAFERMGRELAAAVVTAVLENF
ncbi:MAG: LPS assembly lipoprotein LptE [Bryobacter sp.]|nr:LPS assembly lipoprotein LptE [Bryobacter sp.]